MENKNGIKATAKGTTATGNDMSVLFPTVDKRVWGNRTKWQTIPVYGYWLKRAGVVAKTMPVNMLDLLSYLCRHGGQRFVKSPDWGDGGFGLMTFTFKDVEGIFTYRGEAKILRIRYLMDSAFMGCVSGDAKVLHDLIVDYFAGRTAGQDKCDAEYNPQDDKDDWTEAHSKA